MTSHLTCIACVFLLVGIASSYCQKSESDLRQTLFQGYDKLVRPVRSTTDVVPVLVNLIPLGIRDVDVKDKEVKFDALLSLQWENPFFVWKKEQFGIDHLSLPDDQVWKPDVTIYTALPHFGMVPDVMTNVYLMSNGTTRWAPPMTIKSRCAPTINQIAGDTFQCTVLMGSATYGVDQLVIHPYQQNPMMTGFQNNHPKWNLESMTASSEQKKFECCTDIYSLVSYDMRFRIRFY